MSWCRDFKGLRRSLSSSSSSSFMRRVSQAFPSPSFFPSTSTSSLSSLLLHQLGEQQHQRRRKYQQLLQQQQQQQQQHHHHHHHRLFFSTIAPGTRAEGEEKGQGRSDNKKVSSVEETVYWVVCEVTAYPNAILQEAVLEKVTRLFGALPSSSSSSSSSPGQRLEALEKVLEELVRQEQEQQLPHGTKIAELLFRQLAKRDPNTFSPPPLFCFDLLLERTAFNPPPASSLSPASKGKKKTKKIKTEVQTKNGTTARRRKASEGEEKETEGEEVEDAEEEKGGGRVRRDPRVVRGEELWNELLGLGLIPQLRTYKAFLNLILTTIPTPTTTITPSTTTSPTTHSYYTLAQLQQFLQPLLARVDTKDNSIDNEEEELRRILNLNTNTSSAESASKRVEPDEELYQLSINILERTLLNITTTTTRVTTTTREGSWEKVLAEGHAATQLLLLFQPYFGFTGKTTDSVIQFLLLSSLCQQPLPLGNNDKRTQVVSDIRTLLETRSKSQPFSSSSSLSSSSSSNFSRCEHQLRSALIRALILAGDYVSALNFFTTHYSSSNDPLVPTKVKSEVTYSSLHALSITGEVEVAEEVIGFLTKKLSDTVDGGEGLTVGDVDRLYGGVIRGFGIRGDFTGATRLFSKYCEHRKQSQIRNGEEEGRGIVALNAMMASCLTGNKDPQLALQYYSQYVSFPTLGNKGGVDKESSFSVAASPTTLYLAMRALLMLQQPQSALDLYDRFTARDHPNSRLFLAHSNLAMQAALLLKNPRRAIQEFQEEGTVGGGWRPVDELMRLRLGLFAHGQVGNTKEALSLLSLALSRQWPEPLSFSLDRDLLIALVNSIQASEEDLATQANLGHFAQLALLIGQGSASTLSALLKEAEEMEGGAPDVTLQPDLERLSDVIPEEWDPLSHHILLDLELLCPPSEN